MNGKVVVLVGPLIFVLVMWSTQPLGVPGLVFMVPAGDVWPYPQRMHRYYDRLEAGGVGWSTSCAWSSVNFLRPTGFSGCRGSTLASS